MSRAPDRKQKRVRATRPVAARGTGTIASFRDFLILRTSQEIRELEACRADADQDHLRQLRALREHLEHGIPSPLVYAVAADQYREWKR